MKMCLDKDLWGEIYEKMANFDPFYIEKDDIEQAGAGE